MCFWPRCVGTKSPPPRRAALTPGHRPAATLPRLCRARPERDGRSLIPETLRSAITFVLDFETELAAVRLSA